MNHQALGDVKVLEFADFVSGPYCGKLLSNQGAQVIKIEKPGLGDKARSWGPFPENLPHPEKSGLFLFLNTNKSGITLNTETAAGRKIFKELVKWADVLIEDHAVKEMQGWGLSYNDIKTINPSLIVTSITPFGQTGPYKDYKGNDLIAAHSGTEAFGNPDEGVTDTANMPPLKVPYHAADFMCGLTASATTLGALLGRGNNGEGQHIDLSKQEALASITRQQLAYYSVMEESPSREFGRKKFGGFLYPCKDGYVVIWIGPHYHLVVKMMGDPEWSKEPMFADPLQRNGYIIELNMLISAWTQEHTAEDVNNLALQYGVPCSLVRNVKDLVNDEQLAFREFWQELDHAIAGKLKYPGAPFRLSGTPASFERPAPLLGEHNAKVYGEILHYSREQLVRMRQGGII
jgi:CoA:oxalate CoA-transferase